LGLFLSEDVSVALGISAIDANHGIFATLNSNPFFARGSVSVVSLPGQSKQEEWHAMANVEKLLKIKGAQTWTIGPKASVYEALQEMSNKNAGALLVIEEGKLVGIFTERDYARKLILKGRFSKDTQVGELMTRNVLYVELQNSIEDCMVLMTNKRVRHLPVMDNDQLVGIVTIGDVVKHIIAVQESTIAQLENYIAGGY
jgi:CBS domain-containing protein